MEKISQTVFQEKKKYCSNIFSTPYLLLLTFLKDSSELCIGQRVILHYWGYDQLYTRCWKRSCKFVDTFEESCPVPAASLHSVWSLFIWEPNYRLLLEWGRQLRAVGCKPAQGFLQPQDTSPTNLLPAKQAAASHINTHSLHKMTLTIQKCIYFYYLAVGFVFVEVITATLSFKLIYWYQTNSN